MGHSAVVRLRGACRKTALRFLLPAQSVKSELRIHMAIFFLKSAYFFANHLKVATFAPPIYNTLPMRWKLNPRPPTESWPTR